MSKEEKTCQICQYPVDDPRCEHQGDEPVIYKAADLKRERIEQIRHLATEQKVEGMLVQEWEIVALCELALRSLQAPSTGEASDS